jgi:AcrR family transcriptional regulator
MTAVSRETLAEPERITRLYRSGRRHRNAAATRQAMIDAVLTLIGQGSFRPEGRDVARLVGCDGSLVTYHFGSLDGLLQVVAEEHAPAILTAARVEASMPMDLIGELAWLILVGRKRASS